MAGPECHSCLISHKGQAQFSWSITGNGGTWKGPQGWEKGNNWRYSQKRCRGEGYKPTCHQISLSIEQSELPRNYAGMYKEYPGVQKYMLQ